MIQFTGLHLARHEASVCVVGRDLRRGVERATPVQNTVVAPDGSAEVAPQEWIRAGGFLLQESFLDLPPSHRKPWGIALAADPGWIALDVSFEPLSPLRLVPAARVPEDLRGWCEEDPRRAGRIGCVLSPKDYFRFAISGGLAADAVDAARTGLLRPGRTEWDPQKLSREPVDPGCWPPVFDCPVRTGRISEAGMRLCGLPGGVWIVAGASTTDAARVAAGDHRRGVLWADPDGDEVAVGVGPETPTTAPEGCALRRSPYGEGLELVAAGPGRGSDAATIAAAADRAADGLREHGIAVGSIVADRGSPATGAAALAAVASGLIRGWDAWYAGP